MCKIRMGRPWVHFCLPQCIPVKANTKAVPACDCHIGSRRQRLTVAATLRGRTFHAPPIYALQFPLPSTVLQFLAGVGETMGADHTRRP